MSWEKVGMSWVFLLLVYVWYLGVGVLLGIVIDKCGNRKRGNTLFIVVKVEYFVFI